MLSPGRGDMFIDLEVRLYLLSSRRSGMYIKNYTTEIHGGIMRLSEIIN
jgi:hypothetical protein